MGLSHKIIVKFLEKNAVQMPDKPAVIYEDTCMTWSEVEAYSNYMAYKMFHMGITRGTHAGIWSTNSPDWVIVYLALIKIGAVPVLINTCYREKELAGILKYAEVEYLFYGDGYKDIVYAEVVEKLGHVYPVKRCINIGRLPDRQWISEESFSFCQKSPRAVRLVKCLQRENNLRDVAGIMFTSGTTARAKGVMLTHYNLVNTAMATIDNMRWTKDDRICITVPLFHCFGLTSGMLTTIILGGTMCILPYYRTSTVLECIKKNQCTVLNGVPSMFLAMIRNYRFKKYDLSSLKSGIIAGSPLPAEKYMEISREIPGMKLIPSYGQTETSPAVSFGTFEEDACKLAQSAGKIIRYINVRVIDAEGREVTGTPAIGEIQVRGYNVMKGYYNLPEETSQVFTADGWLRTGDLGSLDKDGNLRITGRIKEMIIRAGENISPHEIEDCICGLPWVEQAVVIGIPEEVIQEAPAACIIVKAGSVFDEKALRAYMKPRLAHYKIPEKIFEFKNFPVSASGKVALGELKAQVLQRIAEEKDTVH